MEFCDFHSFVGHGKIDRATIELVFATVARYGYEWQESGPNKSRYWMGTELEAASGLEFSKALSAIESSHSSSAYLTAGLGRDLYVSFASGDDERNSTFGRIRVGTLLAYFDRDQGGDDNNAKSFFNLCRDVCIGLEPLYALGDWEEAIDLPTDNQIKEGRIDRIYWLNCFGPELASLTGRRLLTTADWYCIETLPYGGILAAAYLNPRNDPYSNGLERVKRIKSHLGIHDD